MQDGMTHTEMYTVQVAVVNYTGHVSGLLTLGYADDTFGRAMYEPTMVSHVTLWEVQIAKRGAVC